MVRNVDYEQKKEQNHCLITAIDHVDRFFVTEGK